MGRAFRNGRIERIGVAGTMDLARLRGARLLRILLRFPKPVGNRRVGFGLECANLCETSLGRRRCNRRSSCSSARSRHCTGLRVDRRLCFLNLPIGNIGTHLHPSRDARERFARFVALLSYLIFGGLPDGRFFNLHKIARNIPHRFACENRLARQGRNRGLRRRKAVFGGLRSRLGRLDFGGFVGEFRAFGNEAGSDRFFFAVNDRAIGFGARLKL